ncbi:unnamed protein product, partial [Heterosigma akashiwo]
RRPPPPPTRPLPSTRSWRGSRRAWSPRTTSGSCCRSRGRTTSPWRRRTCASCWRPSTTSPGPSPTTPR